MKPNPRYTLSVSFEGDHLYEPSAFWRWSVFYRTSALGEGANVWEMVESGCAKEREKALAAGYCAMARHLREGR